MMRTLDIPTTSISEVKRSPMEAFHKAAEEAAGVYVFNRDKVAGVMVTKEQYESLNHTIEDLYDRLAELTAQARLLMDLPTFSDEEVRGNVAKQTLVLDENDGWE